jgi:hypothetical protein
MTQWDALGKDLKGVAALPIDGRQADVLVLPPRQVSHLRFERFAIGILPGPRQRKDVPVVQIVYETEIGAGDIGGIGYHDALLAPGWWLEVAQHLAKQGIFGLVVGRVLAAEQGKIDEDMVDIPLRHQDDDAKPKDIRMMLTEPGFVGYRMLGTPLFLEGAVAYEV